MGFNSGFKGLKGIESQCKPWGSGDTAPLIFTLELDADWGLNPAEKTHLPSEALRFILKKTNNESHLPTACIRHQAAVRYLPPRQDSEWQQTNNAASQVSSP